MTDNARLAPPSPNTRRWRRYDLTVPLRIAVEKTRQINVMSSRGSQINGGGLALLADTELAVGDEAEIVLPDYSVTLRAVIRNRAGSRCGVKFLATTPEEAEQLARFRQALSSREGCLYA